MIKSTEKALLWKGAMCNLPTKKKENDIVWDTSIHVFCNQVC